MKIVHLSTSDFAGGAARAALRVHDALRRAGAASTMFVASRDGDDPDVIHHRPDPALGPRVRRMVRKEYLRTVLHRACRGRPPGLEIFRDDREDLGPEVARAAPPADVYHLHQITRFVDYRETLGPLAARAPLVWTLHEMSPLTGGCHYNYGCSGFTVQCGRCPQLGSIDPRDLSHQVWKRKAAVFASLPPERLQIVCPSRWMRAEVARSTLLSRFPACVIPYGIDTETFHPMRDARRLLDAFGVPPHSRVALFLADYTGNHRKGFALLDAALRELRGRDDLTLLSIGRDAPRLQSDLRHIHLGALTEDRLIAAAYSMADVFVIPSLQDNLPNTVIEALACGTPVIGFNIGGIPDMVRHGENGLLVPSGDVAGLAEAISSALSDGPRLARMAEAARAIADREYSLAVQSSRYLSLYGALTGASPAPSSAAVLSPSFS